MKENGKDQDVTYRSIYREREYGGFWYSGLWKVLRPVLVGMTVAVIVAGLGMGLWNRLYEEYIGPMDAADETEVSFAIESGQSLTRVANNLEKAGLIHSRSVFKYYCDFAGMGQKLQIGQYSLNRAMSMTEIADRLTTGDGNPLVRNITLIPGKASRSLPRSWSAAACCRARTRCWPNAGRDRISGTITISRTC